MASRAQFSGPPAVGSPEGNAGCRWAVVALLTAVPLVFTREAYDPALYTKLVAAAACAAVLAGCWGWGAWHGMTRRGPLGLDLLVLVYAGAIGIGYLAAVNTTRGGLELAKVVVGITVYFAVARCAVARDLATWSRAASLALAAVSAIGIAQYLGVGLALVPSAGIPSSTFYYRNFAAMYLIMALPLAAVPFLMAADARRALLWSVGPALGALLLIYTRTRGAWVGLTGSILVLGFALATDRGLRSLYGRPGCVVLNRGKVILLAGMALFVISASQLQQVQPTGAAKDVLIPAHKSGVVQAASSILEGEHSGRLPVWRRSLGMIQDHPLTGVGLSNWEIEYPLYSGGEQLRPGFVWLRPHNDYIWIAAELGLPVLGVFLALLVSVLWLNARGASRVADPSMRLGLLAVTLGLVAISGHAFFSFPRERPTATVFTWLFLGIAANIAGARRPPVGRQMNRVLRTAPAAGLVLMTCLAGWHVLRGYAANQAYFHAIMARAEDRWDDAARHVGAAVDAGIFDYRYLLQQSEVAQHLGRMDEALRASERCLDYHPNSISAWYNVGQLRAAAGDYSGAREALARTVALDPDNGQAYGQLGVVYRRLGEADSARIAYSRALELRPNDRMILYNAAIFHRWQGDVVRAQELFLRAVRLDSTFLPGIRGLAETHHKLDAYAAAAAAYRAAIRLDPEQAEDYYGLGLALERLGDGEAAAGAYGEFLNRWRGDPAVAEKVVGYIRQLESP